MTVINVVMGYNGLLDETRTSSGIGNGKFTVAELSRITDDQLLYVDGLDDVLAQYYKQKCAIIAFRACQIGYKRLRGLNQIIFELGIRRHSWLEPAAPNLLSTTLP